MAELAAFWDRLERDARPHVEQQLARLGWVLKEGGGHCWRAERVRPAIGKGMRVGGDSITRTNASSLLDVIQRREQALSRGVIALLDFDEQEGFDL